MNDVNTVTLEGRLVRDAEIRDLPSGKRVMAFTLANNRYWKKEGEDSFHETTSFITVEAWDSNVFEYKKGDHVTVQGRLQQDRWGTPERKMSAVKIVAREITLHPKVYKEVAA